MHCFQRALLFFTSGVVFAGAGWAQNIETFSAGSNSTSAGPGGQYDASVCNDPRIPVLAAQQKATPYHDPNWNTPGDPLKEALDILAEQYNNSNINNAGACAHGPGVVYMVPINLVPAVTKLVGQIETVEFGGAGGNNGTGGTLPGGTPAGGTPVGGTPSGGTPGGGTPSRGQPPPGGTNGGPGNRGGPTNGRGGPNFNDTPRTPGPAGGIGYQPGPNPCLPKGPSGYDYCANGPGARLPAGCICDMPAPGPGAKTIARNPTPFDPEPPPKKPVPPPPPPPLQPRSRPVNLQLLQQTMNKCLKASLPYWTDRVLTPVSMFEARLAAPKSGSFRLDPSQLPQRTQVMLAETAMAIEAQRYHDSMYGPNEEPDRTPLDQRDWLVGWFDRCLANAGLVLPNYTPIGGPPEQNVEAVYANFLGIVDPYKNERLISFIGGYGGGVAPYSLLAPEAIPSPRQYP